MTDSALSEAIVVWTGWQRTPTPARDDARVLERFGESAALELLPSIHALEDDFYKSDARHVVADLSEIGERAASDFRARHPEISADAVQAFAWCYTYDYK